MQRISDEQLLTRLRPKVLAGIRQVLAAFADVEVAYLFGSRARGTHRIGSDIDLALIGPNLTHRQALRIGIALDKLEFLEIFDVVVLDATLSEVFRERIEREGVEVWRRVHTVLAVD